MKKLVTEYLRVLCRMCGGESARLKVAALGEDGAEVVLLDNSTCAGMTGGRIGGPAYQIPLVMNTGISNGDFHHRNITVSKDLAVDYPFEDRIDSIGRAAGWRTDWKKGESGLCYRTNNDGLSIELHLSIGAGMDGIVQKRMERLEEFTALLEPVIRSSTIDHFELKTEKSESIPFNPPMLGISGEMRGLREKIRKVARSRIPVLIEGESGSGKEVVARNIHHLSSRSKNPIVIVNCMEMPPSLLQGELFGHMRGSFTGAQRDRRGLIESADGGSFFLDEIGEMPVTLQTSLLRVLQEQEIRRLGESSRRRIDVRFLFATNKKLVELVRTGKFREDLFYRVNGIQIFVPPLRKRREDILVLARHFLRDASGREGSVEPGISVRAARLLTGYNWPGNVRELKNEIERIIALHAGAGIVAGTMISPSVCDNSATSTYGCDETDRTMPSAVRRLERKMIAETLVKFGGNRTRTAQHLGITRQGLLKKIRRFGMNDI